MQSDMASACGQDSQKPESAYQLFDTGQRGQRFDRVYLSRYLGIHTLIRDGNVKALMLPLVFCILRGLNPGEVPVCGISMLSVCLLNGRSSMRKLSIGHGGGG